MVIIVAYDEHSEINRSKCACSNGFSIVKSKMSLGYNRCSSLICINTVLMIVSNNIGILVVNFGIFLCLTYILLLHKCLLSIENGNMIEIKYLHAHLGLIGYYCCLRRAE